MDEETLERLKRLREEIRALLCNQLTYPKTILSLLGKRSFTEEEKLRAQRSIDQSLHLVDAKFDEFLMDPKNYS